MKLRSLLMHDHTRLLFSIFQREGLEDNLFIFGGAVRDNILNKYPKDIDFFCTLERNLVLDILYKNNLDPFVIEDYPYIGFYDENGEKVDMVILNKQKNIRMKKGNSYTYISDFRRHSLDIDLTINALYLDMSGKIIDPTKKGVNDLREKIIRFNDDNVTEKILKKPNNLFRYLYFLGRFPDFNYLPEELEICLSKVNELFPYLSNLNKGKIIKAGQKYPKTREVLKTAFGSNAFKTLTQIHSQ